MHWSTQYLNKPWEAGARGPDAFDCWGIFREVYLRELGIPLAMRQALPLDGQQVASAVAEEMEDGCWRRVSKPIDYDGVALSQGLEIHHVGIWIEADGGLVLHALDGRGTVATSLATLARMGYRKIEYYRHALRD